MTGLCKVCGSNNHGGIPVLREKARQPVELKWCKRNQHDFGRQADPVCMWCKVKRSQLSKKALAAQVAWENRCLA